ncbi:Uncharacterised protein [Kluyvera cryocrescens]|uniref:Uncharacterized protein n=1 Tax=Kluyvera cryocrescens TaxID=580 RepID=A0A485CVL0_KLUCR|nr:Uncharacterised protein [Kluyvera cryocrescens]
MAGLCEADNLEGCVSRRSWERDHVANVLYAGHISNQAFEAEAKTGMRHSAVATQVAVPPVVFFVQTHFSHTSIKNVQTLFTLGTPMISPIPGARTSMAATVLPSSLRRI